MLAAFLLFLPAAAPPAFIGPLVAGRPVAAWLHDLRGDDVLLREEAAEALGSAGDLGKPALPLLRGLAQHPERHLRRRALVAAWRLGDDARLAALALAEGLKEDEEPQRSEALALLERMGPAAAVAVPHLARLAEDAALSRKVLQTLERVGRPAVPGLLAALGGADVAGRRGAAIVLAGPFADTLRSADLEAVAPALLDPQPLVRIHAARLLYGRGCANPTILSALGEGLRSPALAAMVLDALSATLDRPPGLASVLLPHLGKGGMAQRLRIARLLHSIERKPARVLPHYLEALDADVHADWESALLGIAEIGAAAKEALPRILDRIGTRETRVAYAAELALVALGKESAPALARLLEDAAESSASHGAARSALGQMGKPAADAVLPLLRDHRRSVRLSAIGVLGSLESGAAEAVPALARLLEDDTSTREETLDALSRIGPAAAAARPALASLAGDARALGSLAMIGTDGATAQRLARAARKSASPSVRLAGLRLLLRMRPDDEDVVPYFKEMLAEPATRSALEWVPEVGPAAAPLVPLLAASKDAAAMRGLASIGPAARAAMPALLDAARNRDMAAAAALVAIDPGLPAVVPALVALASQGGADDRRSALALLGRLGPRAAGAFAEVAVLAKDEGLSLPTRQAATLALARIDPARARKESIPLLRGLGMGRALHGAQALLLLDENDPDALSAFRSALRSSDLPRRANAVRALRSLGPAARPLLPALRLLVCDREPAVRAEAVAAFLSAGGDVKEILSVIEDVLASPRRSLRGDVADLLAGDGARPLLPHLKALADDPEPQLRARARRAVARIEPRP